MLSFKQSRSMGCEKALLILIFAVMSSIIFSQETEEVPRRLLLFFEQESGSELSGSDLVILYDSLLVKLNDAQSGVDIYESPDLVKVSDFGKVPASDIEKSRLAKKQNTDAWLWVVASGGGGAVILHIRSFDLLEERTVIDFVLEKEDTQGVERRFWDTVVDAVKEKYSKRKDTQESETLKVGEVLLRGVPGTEITGLTEETHTIGPDGEVRVPLFRTASYSFLASYRGYYQLKGSFYLESSELIVDLDQKRLFRLGFDLFLDDLAFVGLRASYFIIPGYFFVQAGLTTYLAALPLQNENQNPITGVPLSNLNISVGTYFNMPEHLIRLYLTLGFFVRFMHIQTFGLGVDPISPFGFHSAIGGEIAFTQGFRFFIEYDPQLYMVNDLEYFEASIYAAGGNTGANIVLDLDPISPGVSVFAFTHFCVGLRVQL